VVIQDDVEIGGLCTIDRGALEDTVIGRGTKLDSHVHVGHGVVIGEHCILCGMTGIAGSAKLGNWVVTGGHSAINNRCVLADRVQVGAMSALTKSAPLPDTYMGFPAIPAKEWRRQVAGIRRASDLEKKVRDLQKLVNGLVKQVGQEPALTKNPT
jgi:UDP-3-O-[3-hydroxymyristoyl] glucosamine N-acyltransferase